VGVVNARAHITTEDEWQRLATSAAISAARNVVSSNGINGRAMVSSLSDIEWGWIVCAAIFGWIETKARQAVAEGCSCEEAIRSMPRSPAPWESGAVASILPALGELQNIAWDKPVTEWSREQIISFIWQLYKMTDAAVAARDEGVTDKIVKFSRAIAERENSAANGGPLMALGEAREALTENGDEIPY
jgi:hypothetical protein